MWGFQEFFFESLSLTLTFILPQWFSTFPRNNFAQPSIVTSVHVDLGYVSGRLEQKQQSASDSKSKGEQDFSSREKSHGLSLRMQNLFWLRCILVYWAESTVGVEFGISASFAMDFSLWDCWVSGERSSLLFDSEGLVPNNLMLQCSGWIWLLTKTFSLTVDLLLYICLRSSPPGTLNSSPCDPSACFYWRLIGWTTAQSLHFQAAPLTFPPLAFCLFLSFSLTHIYTDKLQGIKQHQCEQSD